GLARVCAANQSDPVAATATASPISALLLMTRSLERQGTGWLDSTHPPTHMPPGYASKAAIRAGGCWPGGPRDSAPARSAISWALSAISGEPLGLAHQPSPLLGGETSVLKDGSGG